MSADPHPVDIRDDLRTLPGHQPGMGIQAARRLLGDRRVVKLSSNENAFGPLPAAARAAAGTLDALHRYPEEWHVLQAELERRGGLEPGQVALGAGGDLALSALIRAVVRPGDEVVQALPTFPSYRFVTTAMGGVNVDVPCIDGVHDLDGMLAAVTERTRLFIICNPNNPTGTVVHRAAVRRVIETLPPHVVVFVDEAYHEYVRDPDVPDVLREYVAEGDSRTLTLRTFSKIQGLAGLRVGWIAGPQPIVDVVNRLRSPFDISDAAALAALASLDETEAIERRAAVNAGLRERLAGRLRDLGLTVYPSETNFVCVVVDDAARRAEELLHEGVIVRPLGGFGAGDMLRISIGRPSEMRHVEPIIERVLAVAVPA